MRRRSHVLAEIAGLDPQRDCQRIVLLSMRVDFPFDTTRALELALFRSFASPRIAGLLAQTGEFLLRAQRRYDDTDLLISEIVEHGYDSARGGAALRRINQLHGRFAIDARDFRYVLSTFIVEPLRWNARFGWRPLTEVERQAYFHFWRAVGERMGMRDLPATLDAFAAFSADYERIEFRRTPATERVAAATRELFAAWFPRPLRFLVRSGVHALCDRPLAEAVGFPRASWPWRHLTVGALKLRAGLLRLLPARRTPHYRTAQATRSHPQGYAIAELGPPGT